MKGARILVVDDNPTNLKLVTDLLTFEGYEVLQAMDAEEAQEIIRATPPALILMDIALPGMDGLTLTRILKADEKTKHISIVALTAFAMKGDDRKAIDAGCDGYITKPVDTRALPTLVAGFLPVAARTQEIKAEELKILVIEDNPSELKLVRLVLSEAGHDVSGAEAAEKALQAVKHDKPHAILLDLSLPGMDGLALARKLKADPETRDIFVVAVTAFPERFTKAAALDAGCDAYLLKPISPRALPAQIVAAVNGRKAENGDPA